VNDRGPGLHHRWSVPVPDFQPFAGGPKHDAVYLEDPHGYEVEFVGRD
jgi:hypothetical protein